MKIQDMKIDINVMCDFEELTGRSLLQVLNDTDTLRMTDVRALVQAGLGLKDPKEAGNALMEYMAEENAKPILELLGEKVNESGIGKKKEE